VTDRKKWKEMFKTPKPTAGCSARGGGGGRRRRRKRRRKKKEEYPY
jgi:hypothetical protein